MSHPRRGPRGGGHGLTRIRRDEAPDGDRLGVIGGRLVARLDVPRPVRATDAWFFEQPVAIGMLGDLMLGRANRDDAILLAEHARIELERFAAAGGGVVVDVTRADEGRDVGLLRALAAETGVDVRSATAVRPDQAEAAAAELSEGAADLLLAPRAETGWTRMAWGVVADTGAPVVVETGTADPISPVRDALDAGVEPSNIAVTDASRLVHRPETLEELLGLGTFVVFDGLGRIPTIRTTISDHEVALAIAGLVAAGHGDRILLGVGLDRKHAFTSFGGHGLPFVPVQFLPYLTMLGVDPDRARRLTTSNLARFLNHRAAA